MGVSLNVGLEAVDDEGLDVDFVSISKKGRNGILRY